MRTTLNLKDELVEEAAKLTRVKNKTELIHQALRVLIEKYSRERLIALGGKLKDARGVPRRR